MKKILGISLVALMSVTAANAEIASKGYVNQQDDLIKADIGTVSNLSTANKVVVPAINELKSTVDGLTSGDGSVGTQISSAIGGLDVAEITEAGKVVTAISETDGKVSATLGQITNAEISSTAAIAPSKIATDANNRFVTDDEKSTWSAKQDALTFDSTPTANSTNPVTSGGVQAAIAAANTTAAGLDTRLTAAEGDIDNLESDLNTANTGLKARMTAAEGDINILNGDASTSGSVAHAVAAEAALRTAADTEINNTIGTVPQGSTVMAEIDAAKTANTTAINALDSTKNAETGKVVTGVTQVDGVITAVSSADPLTNANYALQQAGGEDGKYVLTAVYTGNTLTGYSWELIERANNE